MKLCPNCGQQAPLNATFCSACGHQYRTQFAAAQTQSFVVMPPVPPAPQPPAPMPWWRWFVPGVGLQRQAEMMKYQAELAAYLSQTGAITPEMKQRTARFMTLVYVVFGLLIVYMAVDYIVSSQRINAEIDRSFKEGRARQEQFNRDLDRANSIPNQ